MLPKAASNPGPLSLATLLDPNMWCAGIHTPRFAQHAESVRGCNNICLDVLRLRLLANEACHLSLTKQTSAHEPIIKVADLTSQLPQATQTSLAK